MLEHVDIPRLESLHSYWADHPPVQWMIASYFGIKKKSSVQHIEEASEFIPVETIPRAEFDNMLHGLGIPAGQTTVDSIGGDACQIKTQN